MNNHLIQFVLAILLFLWARFWSSPNLQPELYGISIGFILSATIGMLTFAYHEREHFGIYLNSQLLKRNLPLRISMAYLFKIESRGKYLLVKNKRFEIPTYQPVGGVYKYFHPEASYELEPLGVISDNEIKNDHKSENDLRLKMLKRKHLRKFIKWFSNSSKREKDPWREFHEELISTNILPKEKFNYINYNLVGQHFEPIHKDTYFKIDTYKYVDIFTPRFINEEQTFEINKLLESKSEEFVWVTEEEINNKLTNDGKRISNHAYKIFCTKKFR